MIEKMNFVTLAGPRNQIDYLVDNYLSKHDIHLENALSELSANDNFTTYTDENPFRSKLNESHELCQLLDDTNNVPTYDIDILSAEKIIDDIDSTLNEIRSKINELEKERLLIDEDYEKLSYFKNLNYTLRKIRNMKFFKYRFGKLPKADYEKFISYLDSEINEVFISTYETNDTVYGVFFAPDEYFDEISNDFRNIHFDEIAISTKYQDTPEIECSKLAKQQLELTQRIDELQESIHTIVEDHKKDLVSAARKIESAYSNFNVRKYSAVTRQSGLSFQVLCGWMTVKDSLKLQKETDDDPNVMCIIGDEDEEHKTTPPTKLRNLRLFKPFELFVKMYGVPGYDEFDPTWFLTITYSIIFGMMFGDLGQGLVLFIGGLILYKLKGLNLAGIASFAGFFSCIFGALFGSFFGFEFESVLNPLHSTIKLPFLGTISTVLVAAFLFGSFMILTTMILNIMVAFKQRNIGKMLFGPNAISGFIFYGSIILMIVLYMTKHPLPGTAVLLIMFIIPLLLIFLETPLRNLINRHSPVIDESPGMFAATAFFEVFDYLITYLSNALSFLRIGVFAISHAAMMQVTMTLAGAENGGTPNIAVVIIGNIIVMAMEGLVVGIQVLRLEYYELFGRFYEGKGREFVPYRKKEHNK